MIASAEIFEKIKEKLKNTVINIKDSEPAFHERVA